MLIDMNLTEPTNFTDTMNLPDLIHRFNQFDLIDKSHNFDGFDRLNDFDLFDTFETTR
jgi:hypothetical protein